MAGERQEVAGMTDGTRYEELVELRRLAIEALEESAEHRPSLRHRRVARVRSRISIKTRRILHAVLVDGRSPAEVARTARVSRQRVSAMVKAARERLARPDPVDVFQYEQLVSRVRILYGPRLPVLPAAEERARPYRGEVVCTTARYVAMFERDALQVVIHDVRRLTLVPMQGESAAVTYRSRIGFVAITG